MKDSIFDHLKDPRPTRKEVYRMLDPLQGLWVLYLLSRYFDNASNGGKQADFSVEFDDKVIMSFEGVVQIEKKAWTKALLFGLVLHILLWGGLISALYGIVRTMNEASLTNGMILIAGVAAVAGTYSIEGFAKKWRKIRDEAFRRLQRACYDLRMLHHQTHYDDPDTWKGFDSYHKIRVLTDLQAIWPVIRERLVQLLLAEKCVDASGQKLNGREAKAMTTTLQIILSRFFKDDNPLGMQEVKKINEEALQRLEEWVESRKAKGESSAKASLPFVDPKGFGPGNMPDPPPCHLDPA